MSKCEFGKTSLVCLGQIVGGGELKINPSKVDVILNFQKPKTLTEVRIFWEQPNIGGSLLLTSLLSQLHCMH